MKYLKKEQTFKSINVKNDVLCIDLNGLFHNSTQKIYEYGSHKPSRRLMTKQKPKPINSIDTEIKVLKIYVII